ncbi:MAG: hypothetical protein ACT4QA_13285 [Panacagrimonas sp.]
MAENEMLKPRMVNRWRSCTSDLVRLDLPLTSIALAVVNDLDGWLSRRLREQAHSETALGALFGGGQQDLFPVGPPPISSCPNPDFADLVASAAQTCPGTQKEAVAAVVDRLMETVRDEVLMLARDKPRFEAPEARSALARVLWQQMSEHRQRLMLRFNCALSALPFRGEGMSAAPVINVPPSASQMLGVSLRAPNGGSRGHAGR